MPIESTRRARFGSAPTQRENNHKHNRGNATGNPDPYAPVPAEKFAEAFTPGAIRIALDRLVGHANLGQDDLPDLVQELLKSGWTAYAGYKPDFVSTKTGKRVRFSTYIWDAMKKRATEILRTRQRKREDVPMASFDDPTLAPEANPRRLEEAASFAAFQAQGASSEFAEMFDRIDLELAIETLVEPYRRAAPMLLIEHRPVDEVAAVFKVKATTVYHVYLRHIREGIYRALHEND